MTGFGRLLPRGEVEGTGPFNFLELTPVDPGVVDIPDGGLFCDSTDDNRLKFKKTTGVEYDLSADCAPVLYTATHTDVDDGDTDSQDVQTPTSGTATEEGVVVQVRLIDAGNLGAGNVRVQLFNDDARLQCVFDRTFDLAGELVDYLCCHIESDGQPSAGTLHADLTNDTGTDSADFQVEVRIASVLPNATPPVGDGTGVSADVVGDGNEYTGGRICTRLKSGGGLAVSGASPTKELEVVAGSGIAVGADVAVDGTVVRTTGDQSFAGKMRFAASLVGLTPADDPGAPVGGAHLAGDLYLDSDFNFWLCVADGTPGTWQFQGFAYQPGIDYSVAAGHEHGNYTASVGAGTSVDVEVATVGRRGVLRRLLAWIATTDYAQAQLDQPFRIQCFPNEDMLGREQLWSVLCQGRVTYLTDGVAAGLATLPVYDVDTGAPDDLIRIYKAAATQSGELGRITVRRTSPLEYDLDEAVVNALSTNDLVMFVTEFLGLTWFNNSAVGANSQKIYLRFWNDGATACRFGYQADIENIGGGEPF